MGVTLKQIAEIAGVSRGTVDRALYDRGRVDAQVAQKIKKIAKELGYQPNIAGRALALSKKPIKIGVIIQSADTSFMKGVLEGVAKAEDEIGKLGGQVLLRKIAEINPEKLIEHMDDLKMEGVNGIALMPTENVELCKKIDEFIAVHNIPIVTLNADMEETKRLCFVGQHAYKAGETAASLMGEMLGGKGVVSILTGILSNRATYNRVRGFQDEMQREYPDVEILPIEYSYDDPEIGYQVAKKQLEERTDLQGFYVTTEEDAGVCRALYEKGIADKIKMVCFDLTEGNIKNLKKGAVNFLIGQNGFAQGFDSINMLFQYFFSGEEIKDKFQYTDISIKNKFNL